MDTQNTGEQVQGGQEGHGHDGHSQVHGGHGHGHAWRNPYAWRGGLGYGGYGGLGYQGLGYGGMGWGGLGYGGLGYGGAWAGYGAGTTTAETLRRSQELARAGVWGGAWTGTGTVADTLRRSRELQGLGGAWPYGGVGAYGAGWGGAWGRPWGGAWGLGARPWNRALTTGQEQGAEEVEGQEEGETGQGQTQQQSALQLAQQTLRRSRELAANRQRTWGGYGAGWGGYGAGWGAYGAGWGGRPGLGGVYGGYMGGLGWRGEALRRSRLLAGTTQTTTNVHLTTSTTVNDTLRNAAEALKRSQMGLQRHVNGLPDVQMEGEQVEEEQVQPEDETVQVQPVEE